MKWNSIKKEKPKTKGWYFCSSRLHKCDCEPAMLYYNGEGFVSPHQKEFAETAPLRDINYWMEIPNDLTAAEQKEVQEFFENELPTRKKKYEMDKRKG